MSAYICKTCGNQFAETSSPPEHCPICEDERQYVGWAGQQWTTLEELQKSHQNEIRSIEPGLTGIATTPGFAIGQRACLIQTPQGNLLWECISLIDEPTRAEVRSLGGIAGIAISHPHFYSSMVEWSRAFDAPIYLSAADRQWVMRPDPAIRFWEGDTCQLFGGLTLIRCGGHFPGGTAVHWPAGAAGRGALLSGDIVNVVSDRRYVSFMYSFPNLIPLPPSQVRRVVAATEPFEFDRIYSSWWGKEMDSGAKAGLQKFARRYIAAIT